MGLPDHQVLQSKFETNQTRGLWVMIQSHPIQSKHTEISTHRYRKKGKSRMSKGGGRGYCPLYFAIHVYQHEWELIRNIQNIS